jgi:outer membrane protein assembly factor BamB
MANDSYRGELDAARSRVRTLEAKLSEKDAAVDARDVELAELRQQIARLERGQAEPPPNAGRRWVWVAVAVSVILGGALPLLLWRGDSEPPREPDKSTPVELPSAKTRPTPATAKKGRTLLWHGTPRRDAREPPKAPDVVDVDGDGHDDVVGLVYTPGKDGHVHAGAFSGVDAQPLWLSDAMGTLPEGISDAYVLAGRDVVLVHATSGTLFALDLATGDVRATQKPKATVVQLCSGRSGPIAMLKDGGALVWRPADGKLVAGAEADRCAAQASLSPMTEAPGVEGFTPVSYASSRERKFSLGSTGRLHQPVIVAYETAGGPATWRARATGAEDQLAAKPWLQHVFDHGHGCVYVEVEPAELAADGAKATGERVLKCLDEATGREKWVADISASSVLVSSFTVGETRLFMARQTRLDVLDAKNGASLGYIGWH